MTDKRLLGCFNRRLSVILLKKIFYRSGDNFEVVNTKSYNYRKTRDFYFSYII